MYFVAFNKDKFGTKTKITGKKQYRHTGTS